MVKNMTEGKPLRLMVRFALPLLLANMLQLLFAVVDSAVIGRLLGVGAFASVGAISSLFWLSLSAVFGMMHGFGVLFAQRFGAGNECGLRGSFATGLILSAILSILAGLAGIFICRPLLALLNTPPELMDGAVTYISVFYAGAPIIFAYNLFGGMLRAMGDSKTPLRAMILATILNITLDFALVIPFGIAGVSAATLLAQLTASAYCFRALKKTGYLQGDGFRFERSAAKELLRLGLPLSFRNAVIEVGGLIVQRYINGYGENFVAGIAAAKRMYSLLLVAGGAVEAAVATFVAQNFGAKKPDRVRQGVKDGLRLMMISTAVIMAITLPLARQILGLLIEGDPAQVGAVLDVGTRQLTIFAAGLPILSVLFLYRSALQGIGNTFIPMLSGFVEMGMRIASVMLLTPVWGDWGVYLPDAAGWVGATPLLVISYFVVYKKYRRELP
jgi:putative MATE family efflux protein